MEERLKKLKQLTEVAYESDDVEVSCTLCRDNDWCVDIKVNLGSDERDNGHDTLDSAFAATEHAMRDRAAMRREELTRQLREIDDALNPT